jgi:protein arginine N-methyltransferase 1
MQPVLIDFHRKMLADRVRHEAFRRALAARIGAGARTVADLGAGTGVLSFFARELGARECWLYDPGSVLGLAAALASANRIDGLHFVAAHSLEVEDPPQVDLVVAEVLGNFAYEEGVLDTLRDAKRFLVPGGALMPCALAQWAQPVASDRFERELASFRAVGHGLDLATAERVARNNMYVHAIEPADLLDVTAARWDAVDLAGEFSSARAGSVRWTTSAPGRVHGIALWWEATLVPGVTLSTSPHAPRTHWDQVYLPLSLSLDLAAGDTLELGIACETGGGEGGIAMRWTARQLRGGKALAAQQTLDIAQGYID